MKKNLLLIVLLSIISFAQAQITTTTAMYPTAGTTIYTVHDTASPSYGALIPMMTGGANQVWDCSTTFVAGDTSTAQYVTPASTPYASTFPASTLAFNSVRDSAYAYLATSSAGINLDGLHTYSAPSAFPSIIDYAPNQLIAPVNFTYGQTVSNISKLKIQTIFNIPSIGQRHIEVHEKVAKTFNADGYGGIKTPTGTYWDVLRYKITSLTVDSIFIDTTIFTVHLLLPLTNFTSGSVDYNWVQNNSNLGIIMELNCDSAGLVITGASYNYNPAFVFSGVNNSISKPISDLSVYPNPANTEVTVKATSKLSNGNLELFDLAGRKIKSIPNFDLNHPLDVREVPNGAYFLNVITNGVNQSTKVEVQH